MDDCIYVPWDRLGFYPCGKFSAKILSGISDLADLPDHFFDGVRQLELAYKKTTGKSIRPVFIDNPKLNLTGWFLSSDNVVYVPTAKAREIWYLFFLSEIRSKTTQKSSNTR